MELCEMNYVLPESKYKQVLNYVPKWVGTYTINFCMPACKITRCSTSYNAHSNANNAEFTQ